MLPQNYSEALKLIASIATPLTIAVLGWLINRTIQKQNALTQRQSSWMARWADDFLATAGKFNDSATSFLITWWTNYLKTLNNMPGAVEEQRNLHVEVLPHWLALERYAWEMEKYAAFAPKCGKYVENAASALTDESSSWLKNKGGNIQSFRQKQLRFNTAVRAMHAELLGLARFGDRLSNIPAEYTNAEESTAPREQLSKSNVNVGDSGDAKMIITDNTIAATPESAKSP
jgi:hypothetical protein